MRLLVLDNYQSFSLVPYLKKRLPLCETFTIGRLADNTWEAFKAVKPDVVFVDFCDENAVYLTQHMNELHPKPRVVIRLHGFEAQSWFMGSVKWDEVAALIVVSPKFKEIVASKVPGLDAYVVSNGIDLDRFQLQEESDMDNDAIVYAGYLNKKKGPTLLRTVMASTPDKQFHIGGLHQDAQVQLYFEDLRLNNVSYYGWIKTEEFLKGKRFVLSTSVTESFGMSLAEGMAMGLTPLVHAWPGARHVWPEECIWRTFDEFQHLAAQPLSPVWCREWIEKRYSMTACIEKVTALLEGKGAVGGYVQPPSPGRIRAVT